MGDVDEDTVRRVLAMDTWAVVGLSGDPSRAAYGVAAFLVARGKRVVPVHPDAPEVHGQRGYASLADVPYPVDVVDVFRRSEVAGETVDEAVACGARAVWLQLGVRAPAAEERARAAGLEVVADRCPKIDWGWAGPR